MKTETLKTVRSYAQYMEVTVQCVYKWAALNLVKFVEIDGVKFVDLSDNNNPKRVR